MVCVPAAPSFTKCKPVRLGESSRWLGNFVLNQRTMTSHAAASCSPPHQPSHGCSGRKSSLHLRCQAPHCARGQRRLHGQPPKTRIAGAMWVYTGLISYKTTVCSSGRVIIVCPLCLQNFRMVLQDQISAAYSWWFG